MGQLFDPTRRAAVTGRSLLLVLVLSCASASASATVRAGDDALAPGIYTQEDRAAVAYSPLPGHRGKFRERLNKELQRHPRNVSARIHRAYLLERAGDPARAQRDYDAALEAAPPGGVEHRHILWSRGWSRYGAGDVAGALEDWQECAQRHGGKPFWVPYTFALAYWTQGDKSRALAWYDAAVASNGEWGTEAGMAHRSRHWRPEQRELIRSLFEAWSAARGTQNG